MPIEDIEVRKAPRDWRMTSDQLQRVESDPRLQRLTRDELYYFFNQPRRPAASASGGAQAPKKKPAQSSGVMGWIEQVRRALGGE